MKIWSNYTPGQQQVVSGRNLRAASAHHRDGSEKRVLLCHAEISESNHRKRNRKKNTAVESDLHKRVSARKLRGNAYGRIAMKKSVYVNTCTCTQWCAFPRLHLGSPKPKEHAATQQYTEADKEHLCYAFFYIVLILFTLCWAADWVCTKQLLAVAVCIITVLLMRLVWISKKWWNNSQEVDSSMQHLQCLRRVSEDIYWCPNSEEISEAHFQLCYHKEKKLPCFSNTLAFLHSACSSIDFFWGCTSCYSSIFEKISMPLLMHLFYSPSLTSAVDLFQDMGQNNCLKQYGFLYSLTMLTDSIKEEHFYKAPSSDCRDHEVTESGCTSGKSDVEIDSVFSPCPVHMGSPDSRIERPSKKGMDDKSNCLKKMKISGYSRGLHLALLIHSEDKYLQRLKNHEQAPPPPSDKLIADLSPLTPEKQPLQPAGVVLSVRIQQIVLCSHCFLCTCSTLSKNKSCTACHNIAIFVPNVIACSLNSTALTSATMRCIKFVKPVIKHSDIAANKWIGLSHVCFCCESNAPRIMSCSIMIKYRANGLITVFENPCDFLLYAVEEYHGKNLMKELDMQCFHLFSNPLCISDELYFSQYKTKELGMESSEKVDFQTEHHENEYYGDDSDSDTVYRKIKRYGKQRKRKCKHRVIKSKCLSLSFNGCGSIPVDYSRGIGDESKKLKLCTQKHKSYSSSSVSNEYNVNGRRMAWSYQSPADAFKTLPIVIGTNPAVCKPPTGFTFPRTTAAPLSRPNLTDNNCRCSSSPQRYTSVHVQLGTLDGSHYSQPRQLDEGDKVSTDCAKCHLQPKQFSSEDKRAELPSPNCDDITLWRNEVQNASELLHAGYYSQMLDIVEGASRQIPSCPSADIHLLVSFGCGLAYYKMKKFQPANRHFNHFKQIAEKQGSCGNQTLACLYLGDIASSKRDHKTSAEYYGMALELYDTENVVKEYQIVMPTEAAICLKQATSFKLDSKLLDAVQAYRKCLCKSFTEKDKLSAHTSLGNLYQTMGDNASAEEEYMQCIKLAQELNDMVSLGWAHSNIGNAYLGLHKRDKALHHLYQSLEIAVKYEQTPQAIGRVYNNIGTAFQALDELDRAEEYYNLALAQAIYGSDIPGQARVYGNTANLLMLRKQYHRAIPHFSEVLSLSTDAATVCTVHHNRGIAYFEWAESKKTLYLKERSNANPVFVIHIVDGEEYDSEYSPPRLPNSILKYYKQGVCDLLEVVQYHEHTLETIKGSEKGLSLSVSLFETNSRAFHRLQDCYVNMGESYWLQALVRAEQCRARTLGELMLRHKHWALRKSLSTPINLDQIKDIVMNQSVPVLHLSYTGAQLLLWLLVPKNGDISTAMVQVPLQDDQFDGKSFDYHVRYQLTEQIVEKSVDLYTPLDSKDLATELVEMLHDIIGKPIQELMDVLHVEYSHSREIVVIPDSHTSLLPLNCLLEKSKKKFLGDKHIFRIMPSLLTMGILDQLPIAEIVLPRDSKQMCVVGNPAIPMFSYNDETMSLGRLPHATKEAECIANTLKCLPLLHEQATKSAVVMRMMNAKIVHLATHGSASAGFLAFAGAGLPSAQHLGIADSSNVLLHPEEVEKLSISAALVVLSSCDSARGTLMADGIQGMARAFLLAGAQSVLSSLWRVPDESACVFMQFFYQYLVDGFKSSHALHKAILSLRCFSKYSQYVHWSGYQLAGRDIQFEANQCEGSPLNDICPSSIFPRLEIVLKLKTLLINDPCVPTDVQVLRGVPGVVPCEPVKDFIHTCHEHFSGGIFWISCKNKQLIRASVNQIHSVSQSLLEPSGTVQTLLVLDDLISLADLSPLPRAFLMSHNVHIIIISKQTESPDTLYRDIDKELIRGCHVHNVEPLSMVHSTQRIVHTVLSKYHIAPTTDDQARFESLADVTCGSPAIVDSISALLLKNMNESNPDSNNDSHTVLQDVNQFLSKDSSPINLYCDSNKRDEFYLHNEANSVIRKVQADKTLNDYIAENLSGNAQVQPAVAKKLDKLEASANRDSWHVVGGLLNRSFLSSEECLLLFTLSVFDSAPIPLCIVHEISTLIAKAAHKQYQTGDFLSNLLKLKFIKKYPSSLVFHPSLKEKHIVDLFYVPQLISSAVLTEVMQEIDKAVALGLLYKALSSFQSKKNVTVSGLIHGLTWISLKVYESNFKIIGKECFQAAYKLCLSSD